MRYTIAALLVSLSATSGCQGTGEQVYLSAPQTNNSTEPVKLEAYVYRPKHQGQFPVVVLNHGSSGGTPKKTIKWEREAEYLTSKGFVVIAPMRRGRGRSTGESLESEVKNCDLSSWDSGLNVAMQDITAVIDYTQSLPFVRANEVVLVGVSRGGFLSVAYAATGERKTSVRSVVNLVGGWVAQAEDHCTQDFNAARFAIHGAETKVPMLWLYGANDLFYGDAAVQSYARAFKEAGGSAEFRLIADIPENGHWLPNYMEKWVPYVDQFLGRPSAP